LIGIAIALLSRLLRLRLALRLLFLFLLPPLLTLPRQRLRSIRSLIGIGHVDLPGSVCCEVIPAPLETAAG
jgi:hypothetical protein